MVKNKEATGYILKISVVLSLVCATLVSIAAVSLKPIQDKNAALEKKQNILSAAGVYKAGDDVDALYEQYITPVAIDLTTGEETDAVDAKTFDMIKNAKEPKYGVALREDPAKIRHLPKYAVVYQLKKDNKVSRIILPVWGYGLWGTMYGFLAMDTDGKTIEALTFYDQKETPGLGAKILNEDWQAKWQGKKPYAKGELPDMRLVKTMSENADVASQQVDALAGATLTSRGVENMINFWLSANGYAPYLNKMSAK